MQPEKKLILRRTHNILVKLKEFFFIPVKRIVNFVKKNVNLTKWYVISVTLICSVEQK